MLTLPLPFQPTGGHRCWAGRFVRADSCAILCPQYWTKQHAAYNTRSPDPCRILPPFLLQFLKPTFLETPRDTLSSTECPLEGHLTAGKSGKDAEMTCVSLHFPPHTQLGSREACVTSLLPLFLSHRFPFTKEEIRARAPLSTARCIPERKQEVSVCLKGLTNVRGFLWRMWLRGLGSWVRTWGRQRSRV